MKIIMNEQQQHADALLAEIDGIQQKINEQAALAHAAFEQVMAAYNARKAGLDERLKAKTKALKAYGKKNVPALFGDEDKVYLTNGDLILQKSNKVVRARTVTTELLEQEGFPGAVKVVKTVDWDHIENWPNERLVLIGTQRKPKTEVECNYASKPEKKTKGKSKGKGKK